MSTDTNINIDIAVMDKVNITTPRMYNVVLWNDSITTMEFVVLVLMQVFHKSFDVANEIMLNIHTTGKGVAGTYSLEVATTKRDETISVARNNNFPLKCEIEPNE